jgi:hypothetical protein
VRNTNMLMWKKELWLIDHGASLYFHHNWPGWKEQISKPFSQIKDHVLLRPATKLEEQNESLKQILTPELIRKIVDLVPYSWLTVDIPFASPEEARNAYSEFLQRRIKSADIFVKEAINAGK